MAQDGNILKVNKRRDVSTTEENHSSTYLIYVQPSSAQAYSSIDIMKSEDPRLPQVGDIIGSETNDYPTGNNSEYGYRVTDRTIRQLEDQNAIYEMTVSCNASNGSSNQTDSNGFSRGKILSLDFDVIQYTVDPVLGYYLGKMELKTDGTAAMYKENGDATSILKYGKPRRITDSAGRAFLNGTPKAMRNNIIMNLVYQRNEKYSMELLGQLALVCGSVNDREITIAGLTFAARAARMNKIKPIMDKNGKVKLACEIEIAVSMPHYALVLDEGVKQLTVSTSTAALEAIQEKDALGTGSSTDPITDPVPLDGKGKMLPLNGDIVGVFLKYLPVSWVSTSTKDDQGDKLNSAELDWNSLIGPIPQ